MINPGTVLQERYLIEKQIGEGGMGAVYLAVDQRFDNYVAIKETFYSDEEFGEAFEREAKILNGLLHPVLPHVSDYFTEDGDHFLVMQFIEGEDASDILKREGAFPVRDVLRWTDNLLDALDYLHSQEPSIIHRDLKPSNLKLNPRGDMFLLDFGLAKFKKENTLSERSVFGYSRRYSPLEQIQGIGTDGRSDLFALAATVYHLLTGKPPVDAIARASAIVAGKPDPIQLASEVNDEIPAAIANVLNSALALNAENRFVSANAMRQALKHAVQGTSFENIEIFPGVSPIVEVSEPKVITPVEDEDFPALTAFAAEALEAPAESIESSPSVPAAEVPAPDIQVSIPNAVASTQKIGAESPTRLKTRKKQSRLPIFAVLALLAIVATVSAIFIFRDRRPSESSETPTETNISGTNSGDDRPETVPETVEQTKIPETAVQESSEKAKSSAVSIGKTARETDFEETEEPTETVREASDSKTVKREPAKTTPKRQPTKSKIPDIDRRERIVENEPVPDIESIFTGQPSWDRDERLRRRDERRRRIDEMSDEEWREMRRRRRQQRRQNQYPIPF